MNFQILLSSLSVVEKKLSYMFKDPYLLASAFVHRSFLNENKDVKISHNERLEFLGDSVLNLLVAEYFFQSMPQTPEGELSRIRAHVVSSASCMRFMHELALSDFVLVGKGEKMQAKGRTSILADAFEAILGAIYLDGGLDNARYFFFDHFTETLLQMAEKPSQNFKALLQEHVQKEQHVVPQYRVLQESGPDHNRFFQIGVFINENLVGQGSGSTKKEAQQMAAKKALEQLAPVLIEDL